MSERKATALSVKTARTDEAIKPRKRHRPVTADIAIKRAVANHFDDLLHCCHDSLVYDDLQVSLNQKNSMIMDKSDHNDKERPLSRTIMIPLRMQIANTHPFFRQVRAANGDGENAQLFEALRSSAKQTQGARSHNALNRILQTYTVFSLADTKSLLRHLLMLHPSGDIHLDVIYRILHCVLRLNLQAQFPEQVRTKHKHKHKHNTTQH